MSEFQEILEEDKAYLERIDMRSILQGLVADAMTDRPIDVFEYMGSWAAGKMASRLAANGEVAEKAAKSYPTEESANGAGHSIGDASHPHSSLPGHEGAASVGHSKEVTAAANSVSDPKVSPKANEGVANAADAFQEL
ncbi:hypothetical protein ABL78_2291 [Leptomonas seymouri]|uniref:Uncharacterized protein n=1 Tax=Leptomonas seymouri TaxID=5684 RepID=A0A0N1HZH4_LEPSE|nr:hypothetical protein ABL78_2291 [Leptomonas seymouri]|eukprot:KPI88623.1 hypothetical protein ABL78_2291 [Leptomonas seymouri]